MSKSKPKGASLITHITKLKEAISAGEGVSVMWKAFRDLVDHILGEDHEGAAPAMGSIEDEDSSIETAVCECQEACQERLNAVVVGGEAVGAWGDGTFLRIILEYLPLILSLIKK